MLKHVNEVWYFYKYIKWCKNVPVIDDRWPMINWWFMPRGHWTGSSAGLKYLRNQAQFPKEGNMTSLPRRDARSNVQAFQGLHNQDDTKLLLLPQPPSMNATSSIQILFSSMLSRNFTSTFKITSHFDSLPPFSWQHPIPYMHCISRLDNCDDIRPPPGI